MNHFPLTTSSRTRLIPIILILAWLILVPAIWQTATPAQAADLSAEVPAQGSGDILYVTANGTGLQCTIAVPCYLTTAVEEASAGDEIRVAAGLYDRIHTIGNNDQTLYVNKSLTLRGGFTTSNWHTPDPALNETILDGENSRRVFYMGGGTVVLDGFTIRNGAFSTGSGAGVRLFNGNLTILHSQIHDNIATNNNGGGIFAEAPTTLTVRHSRIYNNSATGSGVRGGGLEVQGTAELVGNEIFQNTAVFGGGIFVVSDETVTLTDNFITQNSATSNFGTGGIGSESTGTLNLWHNTIAANSAPNSSGGGGGVALFSGSVTVHNNIIADNTASGGNTGLLVNGATVTGSHNNLFNNTSNASLTNPIAGDPLFVNSGAGDYHLQDGSPNLNAATAAFATTLDIDQEPRPFNGGYDVGADEHYPASLFCFARTSQNGTDGDVYGDIQTVVDLAQAGDTVKVAGLCTGTGTAVVTINKDITLRGGYSLTDWSEANRGAQPTQIDGENSRRLILITGGNPTIDSFALTGGNADNGAAIFVQASNPLIINNTIYDNTATNGGAIGNATNTSPDIQFNTIVNNSGEGATLTIGGTVQNSIVYGNSGTPINGGSGHDFNLVGVDPQFVDEAGDDYRLTAVSPALAAADPNATLAYDFEGDPRPRGRRADIGADEANSYPAARFTPTTLTQEVERDTTANLALTFTSDGTLTDTWDISLGQVEGWATTYPTQIADLAPGASVNFPIEVIVPNTAVPQTPETLTFTATSQLNNNAQAIGTVQLTIKPIRDLFFTPSYTATQLPGDIITFTHTLTNSGEFTDTFRVQILADPFGWGDLYHFTAQNPLTPTQAPGNQFDVTLGANSTAQALVQITVPEFAPAGFANDLTVQAFSIAEPTIQAIVTDTVTAKATVGTRYVSPAGNDTNNNCRVRDLPCETIERGVNQASTGDAVYIAIGNYTVTEIGVNTTISIRGGWKTDFSEQVDFIEGSTDVSANDSDRHFDISGSTTQPTLERLVLRDGNRTSGGAMQVRNGARVSLSRLIFVENAATRGGALYVTAGATAVVNSSRFLNNQSSTDGGAIFAEGTVELNNSLLVGNTADQFGGAIYSRGTAVVTIWHNTFDNNQATTRGGAIYQSGGSLLLRNSNLTNNQAPDSGAIHRALGSYTADYNNIWNNSAPASNEAPGANSVSADPDYNDDLYRLSTVSAVLDIGDPNSPLTADFEGNPRPSDQGFDIGWYELAGCLARRDGTIYYSIQEAIAAGGSDLIQVSGICRGVNTIDVSGTPISQTIALGESLHIQGGWNSQFNNNTRLDPQLTLINPQGLGRGLYIYNNASPLIESITIVNGSATDLGGGPADADAGGGVYVATGAPQFSQLSVYSSTAVFGGGVYNHLGNPAFILTGTIGTVLGDSASTRVSDIAHNTAVFGGGLYSDGGNLTLGQTFVRQNSATDGAGIYLSATTNGTLANTVFTANAASGNGGAIHTASSNADLLHLTFYENSAAGNGGAVYLSNSNASVRNSIFQGDTAVSGPAIFNAGGVPTVDYNYYHDYASTAVVGTAEGNNSINSTTPPGLSAPTLGDFRLMATAAALDAADPASTTPLDFENNLRPSNQGFDMGADELAGCYARLNGVIYGSPQAALAQASDGDTIDVAGICLGVHEYDSASGGGNLGVIKQTLHIDRNVNFVGGWDIEFTTQEDGDITVFDALGLGRVVYIAPDITATLTMIDLRGGNATVAGGNNFGGGVYVDQALPTLEQVNIYNNTAERGGGLYVFNGQPVLQMGNHIYENTAVDGAGIYIRNTNGSIARLHNNFIYDNNASNHGGGIYTEAGNNRLLHNTLVGNSATNNGGGVYIAAGSPHVQSTIFVDNTATSGSGAFGAGGTPLMGYNNFFNNNTAGTANGGVGNLALDPLFTDPALFDYSIQLVSPVANQGDPNSPILDDYEGDVRPAQQYPDMGADEVGDCYARIAGQPTIYRSLQLAIDTAVDGDTVEVDGLCRGVNEQVISPASGRQAIFIRNKDITIDGSWDSGLAESPVTIIDAIGAGRVLYVESGTEVEVKSLTLTNGDASAAGFGIGQGGGVYNAGQLVLTDVSLTSNTAVDGGALFQSNDGTLLLQRSYIYQNSATNQGGAFFVNGATASFQNNFIYENTAVDGGALYHAAGRSILWHNTLVGNAASNGLGGALFLAEDATVASNIIDSNDGSGIHATLPDLNIRYNNVVANNGGAYTGQAADLQGGIALPPLYIGADANDYHLQDDSPGIDVGDPNAPITDDIDGATRPVNLGFDIGADEVGSCLIRVVGNGNAPTAEFGVVQTAVDYAETNGLTDLLVARGECTGVQERNGSTQIAYITQDLNFVGSLSRPNFDATGDYDSLAPELYSPTSRFNALDQGRVLYIAPGANPTFSQIAFVGGQATGEQGGAIFNEGTTVLNDTAVCQSRAQEGGAIYNNGDLTIVGAGQRIGLCTLLNILEGNEGGVISESQLLFDANSATQNGGAIFNDGTLFMTGIRFSENAAGQSGGAIFNNDSLTAVNISLVLNGAGGNGGAIFNSAATTAADLTNAIFYGNEAGNQGGGLYHSNSVAPLIYHATFNANEANEGGAVYNQNATFTINSSIFVNNTAVSGSYGGLFTAGTDADLSYNNFFNNLPQDSAVGTGDNAVLADPLIPFISALSVNSPAIDQADPSLVTLGEPRFQVDHRSEPRPDGGTQNEGGEVSPYRSDIGAYEWSKLFACQITPAEQTRNVPPGGMTTYEITVRNLGGENIYGASGFRDQLTVRLASSSQGWATMIGGPEQTFELDWQETAILQVQVQVPLTALVSQVESSLVTCESVTTGAEASATYTTRVDPSPGVLITPDYPQITAVPGEVITYSHTVTNIGNNDDTFELIANPGPNYTNAILVNPDGTPFSPNPFPLDAGESRDVLLRVTVLNTAPVDGIATPGAVVRSTTDPEISDAAQNSILIDFAQGPRYVAQGDTSDADNNCTVPTNPCATSQHAIGQASAGDTIFVSTGLYTDFYTQTVGTEVYTQTLFINKAITITGGYDSADEFTHFAPLTNTVRFSGEDNRRVFFVTDGVTVTLQSLFISNGQVADNGAGVYNDGANLTLKGVILENNQAGGAGAGLYQATGQLHLNSTVLADNIATGNGGGLAVADGVALLENNSFRRNESIAEGGGFAQAAGELTLYNNIFSENGSVADASTAAFLVADPGVTVTARGFNLYHLNDGSLPLLPTDITADPLFVSAADFHLQGASPAVDVGTSDVLIELDIDGDDRLMGAGVDLGADELIQIPDFAFAPPLLTATIATGTAYTYTFTLSNTGSFADSYTITRTSATDGGTGWGYTVVPTAVTSLPVGEAISVTLVITGGSPGYVDTSDLTAVSAADPALTHTVTAVTRIEQTAGVLLTPSQSDSGLPDQTLVYTHQLTNTGDGPDSFGLSVTAQLPEPWAVTLVPTQTSSLLPGQSIPVTVTVQVPADALSGTVHQAVVTAVSAYDPAVTDTVTDTTTVLPTYGLLIEPAAAERIVPPGALATYTHTVRHLGNYSDTITIDTAGFGPAWVVSPTLVTLELPPFGTDILAVSLDVPTGTTGLTHTMFITATSGVSTAVQATAVNTTTVQTVLGVILQPDRALSVLAGQTAVYSHTLTNSGNVADSFTLDTTSTQGWVVSVVPSQTASLAPNQSIPVTVTVAVPGGTAVGTIDTALITATSQLDTAVSDTVTDTTTIIDEVVGASVILQPDRASLILPGQIASYNHTLTNTGDSTDSFDLTANSSEGWQVNITPNNSGPLAPNETLNVTVAVVSPPNVTVGTVDTTVITATSSNDTAVSDTATDTTRIIGETGGADVDISPNNSASSLPDQTVFYYHMVRNDGDASDTFDLSAVSSEGWPVSLSQATVSLAANAQQQIEVQVTVPATATVGTVDVTTVTARSTADNNVSDTATNTTTVTENVVVDLSLEPDNAADGTAGQTLLYNHTLTNLGNQSDTFSLATVSSNGWVVAVAPLTVSLEAGQQAMVTVTVDVPTTAVAGTIDNTTVVAVSGNDTRVQAVAINTTTIPATPTGPTLYLPIVMRQESGTTPTPTPTPGTPTPTPTGTPVTPTPSPTATGTPTGHTPVCIRPTLETVSGVDLVVVALSAVPSDLAVGQGAMVTVSIRNQGTASVAVGNNFYLDVYVNQVPAVNQPGNLVWGVQGADLGAGETRTFTAQISFDAPGDYWLYAQVDTDQTVSEVNEGNNQLGGCDEHRLTVTGTSLRNGELDTPTAVPAGPRHTPTPFAPTVMPTNTAVAPLSTLSLESIGAEEVGEVGIESTPQP